MGRMPVERNIGYFPGRRFSVDGIPSKLRGTRTRWTVHPEKSESGVCDECQELAGQFMSIEEGTGLMPLHPNCVCSLDLEPAPGVESGMGTTSYSLQARNPELWRRAVEAKARAFSGGFGHDH